MTRLREALEKAEKRTDGELTGSLASGPLVSAPAQLVPDSWDLAAAERDPIRPENRTPAAAGESHAATPTAEPSSAGDRRARAVEADASIDSWASYRFGKEAASRVVVGRAPNAALVEQYRRLGAALHHHQLQGGAHTLMVTSAIASEGKTLTATNLALTLSHSYKRRVLLIDADLRRPSVHEVLGLPNSVGLTDILRHNGSVKAPFQTVSPMLSALTAGRPNSDPMAGLVSDTMSRLLTEAGEQYDWVIVDTPPVALLPDANLLAAMIDTALLVISANATPYPLVARAVEAIGEQRILGVVLNRMAHAEMIGSYNYYGYGGHYYDSETRPSTLRRWLPFLARHKPTPRHVRE